MSSLTMQQLPIGWKPGFRFKAGQLIVTPDGAIATALEDHTTEDVFNPEHYDISEAQGVGPPGPPGPNGPQGPQGAQGPAGSQGVNGAPGAASTVPGPQGPPGAQGPAGPQGANGAPGPQGANGTPGPQGVNGAPGPQGPAGSQGANGAPGPQGAPGAASTVPGPAGPQGSQGAQGAPGAASTVPGPQGSQGAQGAQGPAGPQGSTGPQGATGVASTVPGPQGSQGAQGAPGAASTVPGPQGSQGAQGPAGPQGAIGPQGTPGAASNVAGPQGANGAPGPQGPPGTGELAYVALGTTAAATNVPDATVHDVDGLQVTVTGGTRPIKIRAKFFMTGAVGAMASGTVVRQSVYLTQINADTSTTVRDTWGLTTPIVSGNTYNFSGVVEYRFQPVPGTVYTFKMQQATNRTAWAQTIYGQDLGCETMIEAVER